MVSGHHYRRIPINARVGLKDGQPKRGRTESGRGQRADEYVTEPGRQPWSVATPAMLYLEQGRALGGWGAGVFATREQDGMRGYNSPKPAPRNDEVAGDFELSHPSKLFLGRLVRWSTHFSLWGGFENVESVSWQFPDPKPRASLGLGLKNFLCF